MEPISVALLAGSALSSMGNLAANITAPRRQYKWNKKAMEDQNRLNRENAEWSLAQQRLLQEEARQYDSPQAQMQRYKDAGLNPNLIYGSGGSAGGAFPVDFGNIAPARLDPPDASFQIPDIAGNYIRSAQALAATGLTEARTGESLMRQQAIELQNEISRTNPMLRPEVAASVSKMMEETARLKTISAWHWTDVPDGKTYTRIADKINREIEMEVQRLGLNNADLAIKNQILQSKEFENVVKELNAKFLRDADVTPEHVRQALMLLLSKMLR